AILSTGALQAQHDLGPRGGLPGAGGAFPTLNANEQAFFNQAFLRFQEVQSVSGDISGEDSEGLGPTFNGNSCTNCHAQPAITGRTDAVGCTLAQPDFVQQLAKDNVVFRIPTPLFGLGLVENTSDATLRANLAATQTARSRLGIGGSFNTNGNDNTITRFGWK